MDRRDVEGLDVTFIGKVSPTAPRIQAVVLDVLTAEAKAARTARAGKAAATKVDFFTLVRGED